MRPIRVSKTRRYRTNTVPATRLVDCSATYRVLIIPIALLYGLVLASLPIDIFMDRENYLIYAEYSAEIIERRWSGGVIAYLANEPLWGLMNLAISSHLDSAEAAVRFIIFIPAVIVAYKILETDRKQFVWLLLALLLPQVVKNHIIHLRQGVAIALFLVAWKSNNSYVRWALFAMTPLIHSSFFFVLLLMAFTEYVRMLRLDINISLVLYAGLGVFISTSLAVISLFLGARQGQQYDLNAADASGLGFLLWFGVMMVLKWRGKGLSPEFIRRHMFALGAIVFYLSTYFLIEVTARIFENILPIVILTGLQMQGLQRRVFIGAMIANGLITYALRFNQPWFGFAVQ